MTAADDKSASLEPSETEPTPRRYVVGAAQLAAWGFVFLILRIFAVSDYRWRPPSR